MTIFIRNCILTTAVLVLPGCLAINALLGVAGFLTTGPIQYAGTVYSVGEYAYEYAVNDKTPDEVIGEKFAWLTEPDVEPRMEGHGRTLAKAAILNTPPPMDLSTQNARTADAKPTRLKTLHLTPGEIASPMIASLRPTPQTIPEARIVQTDMPSVSKASSPITSTREKQKPTIPQQVNSAPSLPQVPIQAKVSQPTTSHEYVERTPDPLMVKLDRMEHSLAQAEQLIDHTPADGIRYSVPTQETGQTETTLSGSWSIRHTLMQSTPAPAMEAVNEAALITAQL